MTRIPGRPRAGDPHPVLAAALPVLLGAWLLLGAAGTALAADDGRGILPFSEVRAGMKGYGKTVFAGARIETFEVEVLGTMVNVAPRRNVILARLAGGPLAQTGVLEGMSGSPVYLDGRLAGAVAYAWGFAREPICGITPIEEMLEILQRDRGEDRASGSGRLPGNPSVLFAEPSRTVTFLMDRLKALAGPAAGAGLAPLRVPLVLGGGARGGPAGAALEAWREAFTGLGFRPVSAGAAGPSAAGEDPIEPGSALAVQLVRGDVEVAAVGTVTWVRGDRLLAFGHPFFTLGPTALPMTRAVVHGLLPSTSSSFKLASSAGPLGLITQDRFPGIAGTVGGAPPVVPVKVTLKEDGGREQVFAYEIADDPLITPVMLNMTLLEIFATAEKEVGDVTLAVEKGSRIKMEGGLDVRIENLYAGEGPELYASATVAFMSYLLMNNPDRPSRVEGIDLTFRYSESRKLARLERIWADRYVVAPGETLPLYVTVHPFRGEPYTEVLPLEIPEETPEGRVILQVGDALTLNRMELEAGGVSFMPTRLEQLVLLLNRIRTNNRIYATLIRADNGIFVGGERLPNLPASVLTVLLPTQREEAGAVRVRLRGLLETERETEYALRGYQKAILEIRR